MGFLNFWTELHTSEVKIYLGLCHAAETGIDRQLVDIVRKGAWALNLGLKIYGSKVTVLSAEGKVRIDIDPRSRTVRVESYILGFEKRSYSKFTFNPQKPSYPFALRKGPLLR